MDTENKVLSRILLSLEVSLILSFAAIAVYGALQLVGK